MTYLMINHPCILALPPMPLWAIAKPLGLACQMYTSDRIPYVWALNISHFRRTRIDQSSFSFKEPWSLLMLIINL